MKIFLTAPPATGKSTLIEAVIAQYGGQKRGIVARELLDADGARTGFTTINSAGQSKQFMSRTSTPTAESIGGMFDVDISAIDALAVPELKGSLAHPDALVYVDEIGRAQVRSADFVAAVRTLLQSKNPVLASIVYEDEPWSLEFKNHPNALVLEVSRQNRNHLPDILLAAFNHSTQFNQLNRKQQKLVYKLLKQFIASGQYVSAKKLFVNALLYIQNQTITPLKQEGDITHYEIVGQTHTHQISRQHNSDKFTCDCDLANGRGVFVGAPETCSHLMSIILSEAAQD